MIFKPKPPEKFALQLANRVEQSDIMKTNIGQWAGDAWRLAKRVLEQYADEGKRTARVRLVYTGSSQENSKHMEEVRSLVIKLAKEEGLYMWRDWLDRDKLVTKW